MTVYIDQLEVSYWYESTDIEGSISQTTPSATQAAEGEVPFVGGIAQTTPSAVQSAEGEVPFVGEVAQTAPAAEQDAAGELSIEGDIAQTTPAATQELDGFWADTFGPIEQATPAATQDAAGAMIYSGPIVQTTPAATQGASGAVLYRRTVDLRGRHAVLLACEAHLRGRHRIADTDVEGYELYRGIDDPPDLDSDPWETSASVPWETAALDAAPAGTERTYHFVLRRRNRFGLASQNRDETTLTVDDTGAEVATPPSAPILTELEVA